MNQKILVGYYYRNNKTLAICFVKNITTDAILVENLKGESEVIPEKSFWDIFSFYNP